MVRQPTSLIGGLNINQWSRTARTQHRAQQYSKHSAVEPDLALLLSGSLGVILGRGRQEKHNSAES